MANAKFNTDDRHEHEPQADVQNENDGGQESESIPSIAQLTTAIDPALFSSVSAIYTRWTTQLATHAPALSLNQPASAADLHALSTFVASQLPPTSPSSPSTPNPSSSHSSGASLASLSSLPADVLSCLLCADGESWSSHGSGVVGNFSLLSARHSLREYQTLCELLDNNLLHKPASPLAPRFTRSYLPIAASPASHYLLAPLQCTHRPVPLLLLPSDGTRVVRVAPSLCEWLNRIVAGLECGRWQWDSVVGEWVGEGAEGFCGVWDEGGKEWDARQDSAVRHYDESALTGLTRDL